VPIYHPGDLYKESEQYCALQTYVCGDQSHYQHDAEENAQSNGKQGANHLDEVIILEKQHGNVPTIAVDRGGAI
jgi:hypothetical protein